MKKENIMESSLFCKKKEITLYICKEVCWREGQSSLFLLNIVHVYVCVCVHACVAREGGQ